MQITLVRPDAAHRQQALAFRQAFFDCGETVINGSELLDQTEDYAQWLDAVTRNADPETVSPDWVVTDTFFAEDESGRIVGIIDLRHTLNAFLCDFGHCGYSVLPSARRQGYATEMLRQITEIARAAGMPSLQISVEQDNLPSVRTIIKNGGVYERSFAFGGEQADVYCIML